MLQGIKEMPGGSRHRPHAWATLASTTHMLMPVWLTISTLHSCLPIPAPRSHQRGAPFTAVPHRHTCTFSRAATLLHSAVAVFTLKTKNQVKPTEH